MSKIDHEEHTKNYDESNKILKWLDILSLLNNEKDHGELMLTIRRIRTINKTNVQQKLKLSNVVRLKIDIDA